jgi:DNA polymerase-3 subunit epsilon
VHRFAVIDFETTGVAQHDRVIEVGVVLVCNFKVVDTFSALMHPGFTISSFITELTGITPAMLRGMPSPEEVMPRLKNFIGDYPCIAHNAAFDQRFLDAEMARATMRCQPAFFCSMLLARRLVQDSLTHKLGPLLEHLGISPPPGNRAHRALDDSLMTAALWQHLMGRVTARIPSYQPDADFLKNLSRVPKAHVETFLSRHAEMTCTAASSHMRKPYKGP